MISNDYLFLFSLLACLYCIARGMIWFFGFGSKKRHKNWHCEQSMRTDKRYAHYFKGE